MGRTTLVSSIKEVMKVFLWDTSTIVELIEYLIDTLFALKNMCMLFFYDTNHLVKNISTIDDEIEQKK